MNAFSDIEKFAKLSDLSLEQCFAIYLSTYSGALKSEKSSFTCFPRVDDKSIEIRPAPEAIASPIGSFPYETIVSQEEIESFSLSISLSRKQFENEIDLVFVL